jgi:CBS domain-containing protein
MKKPEPVSLIMTKHVFTVKLDDKLLDVYEMIRKHHVRHVPVVFEKKLVGIISRTDLNRLTFSSLFVGEEDADDAIFEMLSITQVMSHKPRVVKDTDSIKEVAKILSTEEFHALPVVDSLNESKLVGIVTTTDVIRFLLKELR